MKNNSFLSVSSIFIGFLATSCGAPESQKLKIDSSSTLSEAGIADRPHSLDYIDTRASRTILIAQKSYQGDTDRMLVDGLGGEAYFRGFNVSGNAKLAEHGFRPFEDESHAEVGFSRLAKTTGSNMIRFLVAWEGVHPSVDTIDYSYLD